MLLPQDVQPEKSLYVIGAQIINTFNSLGRRTVDIKTLYASFQSLHTTIEISFTYFLYALDWLYIIGFVDLYNGSKIKRCF